MYVSDPHIQSLNLDSPPSSGTRKSILKDSIVTDGTVVPVSSAGIKPDLQTGVAGWNSASGILAYFFLLI